MPKAYWSKTFLEYSLCLVAFSIPFPFIYSSICIGIVILAWLIQFNFKDTFINFKERKALWLWILFYALHAVSYFYSQNKVQSSFDLQQKISFVILPVVIGAGVQINKQTLERIFISFIAGITLIGIYCLTHAIFRWYETGDTNVFFYHELISGLEINAVYMAWYCLFSICLLLFLTNNGLLFYKWIRMAIIIIQIMFFTLLSSRMLIAIFFIVVIPIYLKNIFNKLSLLKVITSITALIILAGVITFTKNPIRDRYEHIYHVGINQAFINDYTNVAEGDFSNLTLRLFIWRIGVLNLNEHHLWWKGTGNGDYQRYQNQKMEEFGIRNISDPVYTSPLRDVNLHNMYMQSLIMLGIPGLFTFILISFLPLFTLVNLDNRKIFFLFHISIICFMMQEAALQTQAGVIYYTFFSAIFWNIKYNDLHKKY